MYCCMSAKMAENGGFCQRNTVYGIPSTCGSADGKNGVIDNVFNTLHEEFNVAVDKKFTSLDSISVKVYPESNRKTLW